MRRTLTAGTAGLLLLASAIWGPGASARPQSRTIAGVVLDVGCLPLPGVIVRVGEQAAVVTDARGQFAVVANGSPAALTARLEGFRTVHRELHPDSASDVRVFMLVGALEEVATVTPGGQRVIDPRRPPESPRLRGRVLDGQCRPLSGVTVRAVAEQQVRQTDADGRFEFASITSGSPAIEVTAAGFVTTEVKDVRMDEKNTGYVDVPMDVGAVRDRVTVSGR